MGLSLNASGYPFNYSITSNGISIDQYFQYYDKVVPPYKLAYQELLESLMKQPISKEQLERQARKLMIDTVDQKLRDEIEANKQEKKLEKKRAAINSIGPEPDSTDVISFVKQFDEGGTKYNYAAIKADNAWYTTGSCGGNKYNSWDDLVLFLVSGNVPTTFVTPLYS